MKNNTIKLDSNRFEELIKAEQCQAQGRIQVEFSGPYVRSDRYNDWCYDIQKNAKVEVKFDDQSAQLGSLIEANIKENLESINSTYKAKFESQANEIKSLHKKIKKLEYKKAGLLARLFMGCPCEEV